MFSLLMYTIGNNSNNVFDLYSNHLENVLKSSVQIINMTSELLAIYNICIYLPSTLSKKLYQLRILDVQSQSYWKLIIIIFHKYVGKNVKETHAHKEDGLL